MARREEFTVGQLIVGGRSNGAVYVLEKDENGLVTRCRCATGAIQSAVAGYAVGCILIDTTTGKVYQNNSATSCTFNSIGDITSAEIAANAITPIKMGIRTLVALADAAATPTIAQLMTSSIFTITPTTARTFTTPTAAEIVAGITGATIGSWFDFTIVNAALFPVTVTAGANVTIVGEAVVNKGSTTFRVVLTSLTAVSIYRMAAGVIEGDIALASGKILVGQAGGGALAVTPSGAVSVDAAGVFTLTGAMDIATIVSQELDHAAFTDNLNTTGYIDITTQIPAGAIVLGWKAVCSEGFTGDTTAIVQVGIAGTLDKYSASVAGSVFAPATVGSSVKAGNVYEPALITARVTVTGATDFTLILAATGKMVVTIYYIPTA